MNQHTPGEWQYTHNLRGPIVQAKGKDGSYYTLFQGGEVAKAVFYGQMEANMKLAAAAPELLEACKDLIKDFEDTNPEELEYKGFKQLINAVNKATGQE